MSPFNGLAYVAIGMMLLIAMLTLSLSGCAAAGAAAQGAHYPLCAALPSGALGCK